MKILIIYAFLVAAVQAYDSVISYREAAESALVGCVKEKGLDKDTIKGYYKHNSHPKDDPVFLDFYGCYWRSMGLIKDGEFDHEAVRAIMSVYIRHHFEEVSEDDAVKLGDETVNYCKEHITGDSIEQQAVEYHNCVLQYIRNNVHH